MERQITGHCQALQALGAALVLLSGPAVAATLRGTVQFPDEVKGGALRHGGYWRVQNGVVPIAPALHDVRAEAVVVLFPAGGAAPAEDGRKAARAEVRLAGLRLSPTVTVVPTGATLTIQNEDRLPHALLCSSSAGALPRQSIPAGGRGALTLPKAGEYLLVSEEFAHLSGAILVVDRPLFGRVEASGAFQVEAPEGRYQARLFWRGAWVATESLELPEGGAELRLKATLPAPDKDGAASRGTPGQSS